MFSNVLDHPQDSSVKEVLPKDLISVKDKAVLIDVREPDEFSGELGHIPGAKLVPLGTIATSTEIDFSETVVFVCRSGGRSAKATKWALDQGHKNVFNMRGGMILWNEEGLETEK